MKRMILVVLVGIMTLQFNTAFAKTLKAITGLALPPYIISENNTGMEREIVDSVFKEINLNMKLDYVPFIRVRMNMEKNKADLAFPTNEASNIKNVYFSDSHITYQNAAITLKKNNLKINNLSDLKDKKIIAFQDAKLYLGKEYAEMAKNNKKYQEKARQESQIAMLFAGRTDAIVTDVNIFKYFKDKIKIVDTNLEYTIHPIFPKTYYKVCFTDENLRNNFNKGLKKIKENGTYDKIINKYVK